MESSLINSDIISDTKVPSQINLPPDAKFMTQDEIDTHIFFMREALAMVFYLVIYSFSINFDIFVGKSRFEHQ